jgi:predicted nucleic-acid-binding Zn-ribbon protein
MGIFGKEEPEVVEVLDKPLRCQVCDHTTFYSRKAVLPGAVSTFLNLDWTAPSCTTVICSRCGYVHWFFPE